MALHEMNGQSGSNIPGSKQNKALCSADCKHDRKEKKGNKKLDLIQCSYCKSSFHVDCIDLSKDTFNDVWPCFTCRLVPSQVHSMHQAMDSIVSTLQKSIETSSKTIDFMTRKCESLESENKDLRHQIDVLTKQVQQKVSPCCREGAADTTRLLLGDSLIKDVDESKLLKTDVVCLPGAKLKDVLRGLNRKEGPFEHIYICAGTNDCASEEFDGETVTKAYKDLVTAATIKVPSAQNVTISSIPPRCDDVEAQDRIEAINANLNALAADTGALFVNHDATFKLRDGTPNDGYLVNDGPHLTFKGTNKLCKNLEVPSKPAVKGNVCKNKTTVEKKSSAHHNNADYQWREVKKRQRYPTSNSHQSSRHSDSNNTGARCWNCYESNHVARACRFKSPISCHSCGQLGHKSKFCSYASQ